MSRRAPIRTIIDGFNLFHRWGRTRSLFCEDRDIGRLVGTALALLIPPLRRMPGTYTVVLDGGLEARASKRSGVSVVYAGPGRNADAAICDLIRADRRPHDITVVTSDRPLGGSARVLGAHPVMVEEFIAQLDSLPAEAEPIPQKYAPPPPEEVAEFLRIFGEADDGREGDDA